MINQKINDIVDEIEEWVIEQRRDIHQHPEIASNEYRTGEKVAAILEDLGFEVKKGIYNTGVTGLIKGSKNGGTIALRFDMDALSINEDTNLPYSSENPGVMHACGHDGHTAMGLGVAKALVKLREEIKGNIKLIFQPAEEAGNRGGGSRFMIKEGVLKNPDVEAIVGMHIWPDLQTGTVGTRVGAIMAAAAPFYLKIHGKGGHASRPDKCIDPILIGAQIINNLQAIVSRNISPFNPAVVSIGMISGGVVNNVIPDEVIIEGTIRTCNEEDGDLIYNRLKIITKNTAESMGGSVTFNCVFANKPVINNKEMVELSKRSVTDILGEENYIDVEKPTLGGEDFNYFAKEVPGVFLLLGYGKENEQVPGLHNSKFAFDERILSVGTRVLLKIAISWGQEH